MILNKLNTHSRGQLATIILSKETFPNGREEVSQKNNSKQLNRVGVKRKNKLKTIQGEGYG